MYGPSDGEWLTFFLIVALFFVGCGVIVGRVTHGVSVDVTITKERSK